VCILLVLHDVLLYPLAVCSKLICKSVKK
jgi:hypothetical protein